MSDKKKYQIWAKDNGVTLKKHTEDVKASFDNLSKKLGNLHRDATITNCIKYSILLHDLGKVLPYFQIVTLGNKDYEPFDVNKDINIYHSLASILFINEEQLKESVGEDKIKYVLSAIAYHHWKNSLEDDIRYGSEKFEKLKNFSGKNQLVENLQNELGKLIDNTIIQIDEHKLEGLSKGLSFTDYVIPPYQLYFLPQRIETNEADKKKWILISGFLQRCDHFASFCKEDSSISLDNIEIDQIKTTDTLNNIKNKIGVQNQDKIWQEEKLTENENNKGNVILIAPTGCGKTEFAFLWSGGQKFFYTLPLRSAVEQIFERAKNIFGEDKVGLLHSDADVYLLKQSENMENIKVYEVAKQLSYPVIVSTGDQFFPYGLRPPGYERIFATFAYSKLVIDEVQAYDPKAAAIIVKFIEHIVQMGGKFLLMTATLPEYVKKEIEERINYSNSPNFSEINLYENEENKYKSLKKHKIRFIKIVNSKNGNKINFTLLDDRIDEIIAKAQNQRVLVILNTVKQAEDVYNKIIEKVKNNSNNKLKEENILLFHSRFTLNKKNQIKQQLETKFKNPKDTNDTEGKILIATQVVEAALDIDADVLYTEICPMDALIQRMGRVLRRHKENFLLDDNAEPNVYVFVFQNGYESGNGRVYDRELIEKTLILLDNPDHKFEKDTNKTNQVDEEGNENHNPEKGKGKKKQKEFKLDELKNIWESKSSKKSSKSSDQNQNKYNLLLSEYDKFSLVDKLYKNLDENGDYLSNFYKTLSILDAGFMSDRKEEAQRMFREILNVSVIDASRKEEFIKKINGLDTNTTYTHFKKDIIAEFVVQVPYYQLTKNRYEELTKWIEEAKINSKELYKKLLRWCSDIYVISQDSTIQKTGGNII